MILLVDVETSDLLQPDLELSDQAQPWVVQMAAELIGIDGESLAFMKTGIRAEGRKIRPGAEAVHGITSRQAAKTGMSEVTALGFLIQLANQARYVVGYGLKFDRDVIASVLLRAGKSARMWLREGLEFVDLIVPAAAVCKLPTEHHSLTHRWAQLHTACEIILGEPAEAEGEQHDSWTDCQRAKRLFIEIRKRGFLEIA